MNKLFLSIGVIALIFVAASAFTNSSNDNQEKDKKARVKIIKEVDGTRTEIDTLIDTKGGNFYVVPGKHDKKNIMRVEIKDHGDLDVDSLVETIHMTIEGDGDNDQIMDIVAGIDGIDEEVSAIIKDIDIDIDDIVKVDSICKSIVITTGGKKSGHGKIYVHGNCDGKTVKAGNACFVVTKGSKGHVKIEGSKEGQTIDCNDPDVVSVKRKDIGDGKEKIEIIRKK